MIVYINNICKKREWDKKVLGCMWDNYTKYFSMGFALIVEMINLKLSRK